MKADKSLEEVWKWKDEIYEETKDMSMDEYAEYIHKGAQELCKKYNLKFKKHPLPAHS